MTVRAKSRCSDVDIGHFAITNWVTCTFDTASSDVIAHKTEAMVRKFHTRSLSYFNQFLPSFQWFRFVQNTFRTCLADHSVQLHRLCLGHTR